MPYAKVVVGLPVEGPFDYIIPDELSGRLKPGVRVRVPFGARTLIGYVVGITKKSNVKRLRSIIEAIDEQPILDKDMLSLAKELSEYYCCSYGEAIEAVLPQSLRKGKRLAAVKTTAKRKKEGLCEVSLVHGPDVMKRWGLYIKAIQNTLSENREALVLVADRGLALRAKERLSSALNIEAGLLYRDMPDEMKEWLKAKEGGYSVIVGLRSAVFAPLNNLGLVIIDEEGMSVYKQDQTPHYNAREAAIMRANIEKIRLMLGGTTASLEAYYLAKTNRIKEVNLAAKDGPPKLEVIEPPFAGRGRSRKQAILSKYLQDAIASVLNSSGKVLIFMNRKGFATTASCRNCGLVLKCPRCNINLVYHFKENTLNCHYCNFKRDAPKICPDCNANYIRYSGTGTEKIESELSRIFVKARIGNFDSERLNIKDADIFVSTSVIIREEDLKFDLVAVIGIDNALNRVDLRSGEKTFSMLSGLLKLTVKSIVIQTRLPHNAVFRALAKKDPDLFYEEELKARKQLGLPPFRHIILLKLRSGQEQKAKQSAEKLFERLNAAGLPKGTRIAAVSPAQPPKLRGKFYWQLLLVCGNVKGTCRFLKNHLKSFSASGIIVTVDVDPL